MDGLTAKVFRTYNASYTLEKELAKFDFSTKESLTEAAKVSFFDSANKTVAILCNHQRTAAKNFDEQRQKIEDQITEQQTLLDRCKAALKGDKSVKSEDDDEKAIPSDPEKLRKKITQLENKIHNLGIKLQTKDDLKEVALSTSKTNYIDPRITIAWCTKVDLDVKKLFTATLRAKFPWAFGDVALNPAFLFDNPPEDIIIEGKAKKAKKGDKKQEKTPKKSGSKKKDEEDEEDDDADGDDDDDSDDEDEDADILDE